MVLESSLTQQATQFTGSLNVKPAPSVEKTTEEQAQEAKIPEQQGDMVSISEEARALIAPDKSDEKAQADGQSGEDQKQDEIIRLLEKRIEELEKEIDEIEESDLPEKQKLQQVQDKEAQLMELRDQLLKAEQIKLKAEGHSDGGGTRASGAGDSVLNF